MKTIATLVAAAAVALPLAVGAQTSGSQPAVTPADQPRTPLEKEQTERNGQAPKYPGSTGQSGMSNTNSNTMDHSKSDTHNGMKKSKGMDHSPTTSGTGTSKNTVDPTTTK